MRRSWQNVIISNFAKENVFDKTIHEEHERQTLSSVFLRISAYHVRRILNWILAQPEIRKDGRAGPVLNVA